jgi:hypothetical protein
MLKKCVIIVMVLTVVTFMHADLVKAQLVKDGLIAYWPLDKNTIDGKNVKDIIGGNDGVLSGAKIVAGKVGDALQFAGVADDIVKIEGADALDFNGKEQFTVQAWINVKGQSGGTCCGSIVAQRDVNAWALRYDNRNAGAEVEFIVCPGWIGDEGGIGVEKDEWHLITAMIAKGGKLLMYLDGEKGKDAAFAPGKVTGGGFATTIGGASDGYFNGIIDEVLIYSKALSEAEIKQNLAAKGMAVDPKSKLAICWGDLRR